MLRTLWRFLAATAAIARGARDERRRIRRARRTVAPHFSHRREQRK